MNYPDIRLSGYSEIVYAMSSPVGDVRYIGRTATPSSRYRMHKYAKTPLGDWVRSVGAIMVQLEMCEWRKPFPGDRERYWIEHYRALGSDLFNVWPARVSAPLAEIEAERAEKAA